MAYLSFSYPECTLSFPLRMCVSFSGVSALCGSDGDPEAERARERGVGGKNNIKHSVEETERKKERKTLMQKKKGKIEGVRVIIHWRGETRDIKLIVGCGEPQLALPHLKPLCISVDTHPSKAGRDEELA